MNQQPLSLGAQRKIVGGFPELHKS